ncbi:short-chain dehydrogenase reductase ATA1 isoform X2 [Jatropha curcas]|uniref:short-chain dehydrogenase reductase ATA1 isoform X2 n=1 Tax=Jatropha curcas TaxID=180498 RepID=UPI00189508CC|nr:short-chain dehydrogenase reductase ATA1 isoform X2 [Jatropha curcas]
METQIHMHEDVQGQSTKRLRGKVAVITGGARGIGAATAKTFAENGASVVIADILDELGGSLADSIGGKYIHCPGGSITNLDMQQVKNLFSVNVGGIFHGIKHAAAAMIKARTEGCIICTSSSAAIMGGLGSHPYTSSKEAILGLMKSSACELGVYGIRVNCISPHGVPSDMLVNAYRRILGKEDMQPEEVSKIVGESGSLLRGKCASVEDVAQAALFLASEESRFITAHNLVIDGGYTSANSNMSFIYQ